LISSRDALPLPLAEALLLVGVPDVVTDMIVPSASLTVVVVVPSGLVTRVVVVLPELEFELPPPAALPPMVAPPELESDTPPPAAWPPLAAASAPLDEMPDVWGVGWG
jgi:hypothetical protein